MAFDKYCINIENTCRYRNMYSGKCIKDSFCAFAKETVMDGQGEILAHYMMTIKRQQDEILQRLNEKQK